MIKKITPRITCRNEAQRSYGQSASACYASCNDDYQQIGRWFMKIKKTEIIEFDPDDFEDDDFWKIAEAVFDNQGFSLWLDDDGITLEKPSKKRPSPTSNIVFYWDTLMTDCINYFQSQFECYGSDDAIEMIDSLIETFNAFIKNLENLKKENRKKTAQHKQSSEKKA